MRALFNVAADDLPDEWFCEMNADVGTRRATRPSRAGAATPPPPRPTPPTPPPAAAAAAAEADAAEDAAAAVDAAAAAQHSLLALPGLDPPPPNVDWAAIRSAAGVMPDSGGLPPLLAESAP